MDITKVKGRIFDIQKYSVHDGPGIRTIVFFKGCPLRCKWCCNPESQNFEIETMNQNGASKIIGRDVFSGDVMKEVMKDSNYFRRSGGGLTLSGGEMLLQKDFASALLRLAKRNGINTAVESTGFAPFERIKELLPYIDTYLLDIKHIDSDKHKEYTSQSNTLILENAVKIAQRVRTIVRVPVIPTCNDSEDVIYRISEFAKNSMRVDEIDLLPYHRLGMDKYEGLGRDYPMGDVLPPTDEKMEILKKAAQKSGIRVKIGG